MLFAWVLVGPAFFVGLVSSNRRYSDREDIAFSVLFGHHHVVVAVAIESVVNALMTLAFDPLALEMMRCVEVEKRSALAQ